MSFLSRVATTGVIALAAGAGYQVLNNRHSSENATTLARTTDRPGSVECEYFSPASNLEGIDIGELRTAARRLRELRTPLNIAMYAFTDHAIAQAVIEEADAGTLFRVYRDGEQYEAEERDAVRYGRTSVSSLFRGHNNIQLRVKPASRVDLMHLKCWSDGQVLRDGSANWSAAGLSRQDNDVRLTNDPQEVREFNRNFEQLWNRSTNIRVQ